MQTNSNNIYTLSVYFLSTGCFDLREPSSGGCSVHRFPYFGWPTRDQMTAYSVGSIAKFTVH